MDKKKIDNSQVHQEQGIITFPLESLMGDRFGRYAKYIIQDRALPDVRDGLKPVQRRILYAMSDLKLFFDKPHKKSARVVGEVIGKYHPHGDTSIYDAMVRMSQWWKLNIPLIDMQGNNGSIDGDGAAAMRYTEARLAKISGVLLEDLDKQTVPFAPNFDDSEREPTVLPAYFPNILTNGSTGIAAGYATNIPPHNLSEIIDACIKIIDNPNTRLETILNIVKGPDFPTGGVVQGRDGIRDAFATGKGKVILNSKWHEEKGNIVIDEIPYEVVKQDLVRKIGEVIDNNPGLGIREVRDETDRQGLRIIIELVKDANLETVRKFLFKSSPLSISYNYNIVVIIDRQPKLLGIMPILKAYINHYRDVLTRKSKFDLKKATKRLEVVDGIIKALGMLDTVIHAIRKSSNRADAIQNLVEKKFGFTNDQAAAIVDMRLYRLTSTDVGKLKEEKNLLADQIKHLRAILKHGDLMNKEIINRLREVRKIYNVNRRTEIHELAENLEVELKDTLLEKRFHLWISSDGYLKAMDPGLIDKNDFKEFGRKPNDYWISHMEVSNLHNLLLVSNQGTYYSIPLYKVEMSKWKDMGIHVNTVATMSGEETIVSAFVVPNFEKATQHLLLTTKLGLIKRTPITDLTTKIFNRSFRIMRLGENDQIVSAQLVTSKTRNAVVVTKNGIGVTYNIEDIPIQGTSAKGVKAANLKNDELVGGLAMNDGYQVLILTDKSHFKKLPVSAIPTFIRPKKGTRLYPEKKRNAENISFCFAVKDSDVLHLLDKKDLMHEAVLKTFKVTNSLLESPKELPIKSVTGASLQKGIEITSGDIPPESQNNGDQGEEYISKAEQLKKSRTTRQKNKTQVSSKIVVNKNDKLQAETKLDATMGDLSGMLGDISSVLNNFQDGKSEKKSKSEPKKDQEID